MTERDPIENREGHYLLKLPKDIVNHLKKLSGAETQEEVAQLLRFFTLLGERSTEKMLKGGGKIIHRAENGEETTIFDNENPSGVPQL